MYWTGSQTCLSLDILRQADAHLLSNFYLCSLSNELADHWDLVSMENSQLLSLNSCTQVKNQAEF